MRFNRLHRPRRPALITDWRRAHRLVTVRLAGLAVLFGLLPPDQQAALLAVANVPPERVPAVLGLLFLVGRLWSQAGPPEPPPPPCGDEGRGPAS